MNLRDHETELDAHENAVRSSRGLWFTIIVLVLIAVFSILVSEYGK